MRKNTGESNICRRQGGYLLSFLFFCDFRWWYLFLCLCDHSCCCFCVCFYLPWPISISPTTGHAKCLLYYGWIDQTSQILTKWIYELKYEHKREKSIFDGESPSDVLQCSAFGLLWFLLSIKNKAIHRLRKKEIAKKKARQVLSSPFFS